MLEDVLDPGPEIVESLNELYLVRQQLRLNRRVEFVHVCVEFEGILVKLQIGQV